MFKVFLLSLIFFIQSSVVFSQTTKQDSSEALLAKFINASSVCAKMTDPEALYERGMLLLEDKSEEAFLAASDCFTSAAMRNHTNSQLELGKLYEKGKGVSSSNIFAYKWYQTAVLLGNDAAIPYRNNLEKNMSLNEIAMANPLIQSTLQLIEMYNARQDREIMKYEQDVQSEYAEFGVDLKQFIEPEEQVKTEESENPLIDALIRDQKLREDLEKRASAIREASGKEKGEAKRPSNTQAEKN